MSLPPRPAALAGREELLASLHELLTQDTSPRFVVLSGLGGVGKTSLAAEYAHRHLAEIAVAWQVRSEDQAVLAQDMAELAAQTGGRELADPRDPVASAHAVLAAFPSEWLLIFDNAVDEVSIRRFLPPAGPGRVVVTSQNQHWPGRQVLEVPVLDLDVAAQFLANRAADQDRAAGATLAAELGRLPLALEQAAAYIRATGSTLAAYLGLFRDRRADLLARGQASGHPASVAVTLGLALSRLEDDSPAAAGLLRLLANLAPEPVPLDLLLSGQKVRQRLGHGVHAVLRQLLGDELARQDAVAALRRYSLVTLTGDGMVLVHRLVQAVTLAQLPGDVIAAWRSAAAALAGAAIPADVDQPAAWPTCAALLPHAQAVLGLTSYGIWQIAKYLGASGSHPAARDMFRQIAQACENSEAWGPKHPDTLAARHELARWTADAGDPAAARDLYAELLPTAQQVFGPNDTNTLAVHGNLAYCTAKVGDTATARDLFAALLPLREQVSDAEHPETLTTRHNLAYCTGASGDATTARDLFAALLPVRERVSGAKHPLTLTARGHLAHWTGRAGDKAAARDLYAELLRVEERVLGCEHPETLATRHNLASYTGEAGDAIAARDLFATLLPVHKRVLGPEHPHTLVARASLAHWTREAAKRREDSRRP